MPIKSVDFSPLKLAKILLRGLTGMILLAVLLIVLLLASLQWQESRNWWLGLVQQPMADQGIALQIGSTEGFFPFDFRIKQLKLLELKEKPESASIWLSIDDFSLQWSPLELLSGRLKVSNLSAEKLYFSHIPASLKQTSDTSDTSESEQNVADSSSESFISGIEITRMEWQNIYIGAKLLGLASEAKGISTMLSANAQWEPSNDLAQIDLQLPYLNWEPVQGTEPVKKLPQHLAKHPEAKPPLNLKLGYQPEQQHLDLTAKLQLSEAFLIPFSQQLALPTGDIQLSIQGQAPISEWQGELHLDVQKWFVLDTQLELQANKALAGLNAVSGLGTQSQIELRESLIKHLVSQPDSLQKKIIEQYRQWELATQINYQDGVVNIQKARLSSPLVQVRTQGQINQQKQQLQIETEVIPADLQHIFDLIDPSQTNSVAEGRVKLKIDAGGDFNTPEIKLAYTAESLRYQTTAISAMQGQVKLLLEQPAITASSSQKLAPSKRLKLGIQAAGTIEQLNIAESGLPVQNIDWQFNGEKDIQEVLGVQSFTIQSGLFKSATQGQFDLKQQAGEFTSQLDLLDLEALLPRQGENEPAAIQGSKQIQAEVQIAPGIKQLNIQLHGQLQQLQMNPSSIQTLIGKKPSWQAQIWVEPEGDIRLQHLTIETPAIQFDGQATYAMADGRIKGIFKTQMDRMEPLGELFQTDISGSLQSELNLTGELSQLGISLDLNAKQLKLAERNLDALILKARATQSESNLEGDLSLQLGPRQEQISLTTDWQLVEDKFNLANLILKAPQSRIKGGLGYDLQKGQGEGRITGKVKKLDALQFWHQQPLKGDLALDIQLPKQENLTILTTLKSKQLMFADTRLDQWGWKNRIRLKHKQPQIQSELQVKSLTQGKIALGAIDLKVDGHPQQLNIELKQNNSPKKVNWQLQAQVQQKPEEIQVLLNQIKGEIFQQSLQLTQPSRIKLHQHQLSISPLRVNYGPAQLHLKGTANLNQKQQRQPVELDLKLENFDLQSLAELESPITELSQLSGALSAQVRLRGNMQTPQIDTQLQLQKLGLKDPRVEKIPHLNLNWRGRLNNRRVTADLTLDGLSNKPIKMAAKMPLNMSILPWQLEPIEKQALSAQLFAELDLAQIADWVQLDQKLLAGKLSADLDIAGNITQPQMNGSLQLTEGRYENGILGLIFADMKLDTRIKNNRLTVQELSIDDGGQGKITAQGVVQLPLNRPLEYEMGVNFAQSRLLRQDNLTLQMSGDMVLTGDQSRGKLAGNLTIDRGEFYLPDQAGANVPELAVEETGEEVSHSGDSDVSNNTDVQNQAIYPMELDLGITIPDKFYVRGRGLESEWQGDLKISGQAQQAQLQGFLEVVRGHFNFLNKRFKFRQGKIDFLGAIPVKPRLNFDMAVQSKEILGIIKLTGTPEDMQLKLESEPMLPQDEVLSRILFDKDLSDISGFQALQLASALRTLTTGGAGFSDVTRNSIGLDSLDINGDDSSGKSVKAGKYISENVFVEVESGVSSGSSTVKVEMELTPRISVDSTVDEKSNTGFGVNWKIDY